MDDVLSAPFVSNLNASRDGRTLVWLTHERGMRNLYVYRNARAWRLTDYTQDDGQEIDSPTFVGGERAIVYVRGGVDSNADGANPNPLGLGQPPSRAVWLVSIESGAIQKVGDGNMLAVSPHGDRVVWISKGQPWSRTLGQSTKGGYRLSKASQLFRIRGSVSAPSFSPDGTKLLVNDDRGDHSYVVIYALRDGRVTYAAPAFAGDDYQVWSPDGRQIAFIRQPGLRFDSSPYEQPVGEPWSIWVADASTGEGHQVWQADPGMGSVFYETDSPANLWWSADNRIAFAWEKDGWRHLYSVDAAPGSTPRLLTPGGFEVETVAVSPDRLTLLFTSNQNDIDRRHIWSLQFGGQPQQLTSGHDNQWSPLPLDGSRFAYIQAGYRTPTAVMQQSGAGRPHELPGAAVPANFPAASLVEPQLVTFHAPDGLELHGQLFVPNDGQATHPGLIFTHGGSRRQMLAGFHYMEAYTNLYESNQYFANHGFVVLSVNYRSGIMYGHDFREAKDYGWRGASEYQDVLAGAAFLRARPDVDPQRLGLYGLSYGGYLTAMGLARNSDIFKAGTDYAGVHDWTRDIDSSGKLQGTPEQRKVAYDSSPVASLDKWRSPVFISQGDDDRNVDFAQGVDMVTRLRAKGVEVQTMVFPNETHENLVFTHMVRLYEAAARFLSTKLNPGAT